MDILQPSYYFDLSTFQHAALLKDCQYVWEALTNISSYLKAFPFTPLNPLDFPQAYFINPELISIGPGTIIEPGAFIQGPCVLGNACHVRHGAYIRGNLIAGNQCVIGHDTEIKNCILLDKVAAAHFAYLGDSILGNFVNLGAGSKCANLRLDHGIISIHYSGQKMSTGLKKMGAILGDFVQMGCNSVTNPGTLIGPHSQIAPILNVGGVIAPYSAVRTSAPLKITSLKSYA